MLNYINQHIVNSESSVITEDHIWVEKTTKKLQNMAKETH